MSDTVNMVPAPKNRDLIRAAILKTRRPDRVIVSFFGEDIEIRQPILKDVLANADNPDKESAVIDMLIKYAYIPGTEERIFEEADAEALKSQPFGADFMAVNNAMEGLTKINPKPQKSA